MSLLEFMRILRYRGNTYASPEPATEAPRPGSRSYRWVQYAIEAHQRETNDSGEVMTERTHLAA